MTDCRKLPSVVPYTLSLLPLLTGCGAESSAGRWQLWAWIVVLAVLAGVTLLLVLAIVTWQKRMGQVRYRLELHNAGNVASRYGLQVEAPEGGLEFRFMLHGEALIGGAVTGGEDAGTPETRRESASRGGRKTKRRGLLNLASTVSGLLISLGNLLPYDVGVHLIRIGSKMRRGQGTAERMGRVSGQMSRQVGEVGGTHGAAGGRERASPSEPAPPPTSSWLKTPSVAPGETLALELLVSPENPYRAQRRTCVLRSRPLGQDAVEHGETAPHAVRHEVELSGLTPFQAYGPFLLLLMGVIVVLVLALQLMGA